MRRLALLLAGGALWLVFAAAPAFADGGPHQLTLNNGTSGLNGDCAACHRAHTAQAADLLKKELPGLCLACHNGTGSTVDVVDGVQFVPAEWTGTPATDTVLGALRGGGFDYTLIGDPARLSYSSRGSITLSFSSPPASGSITLTWPAFTGFAGGNLTFNATDSAATVQTAATALFGTDSTYSSSTSSSYMSGLPAGGANVIVTKNATTGAFSFAPHNAFRLVTIPLPSVTNNTTGTTTTVTNGINIGGAGHVSVVAVADKAPTTSTHLGDTGIVWGNGAQGSGTYGTTGVVLECTSCHNPHGNGQYRILHTGSTTDALGSGWTGFVASNGNGVPVADVGSPASVKNYTVLPTTGNSYQAADVVGTVTQGDYWRYKYDPTGAANFTNFYLKPDDMNTGWNGTTANPANSAGALTAWCVQCHTRYNGYSAAGTTSLVAATPVDSVNMFRHGTTRVGCEQCHVSHGTSAAMTAPFSSTYEFSNGSPEDSALLKVANRGTCNLCHDPTGTVTAGTPVGAVPGSITPGP